MLKSEITKEHTKVEINGTLTDICADLTRILHAINERLSEKDHETGHAFRVLFTKGFMDGICFGDDREHMEHYLAEGDRTLKKGKDDFVEFLEGFIEFLKEKRDELEREKDNEAE